ncbi:MAG: hypothetical protein R2932_58935 [Caldilineaceae bacterium]
MRASKWSVAGPRPVVHTGDDKEAHKVAGIATANWVGITVDLFFGTTIPSVLKLP